MWHINLYLQAQSLYFLSLVRSLTEGLHIAGTTLRCDVDGKIQMKCFLSGMPELKLGLNEKMGDMTFHQCVNLATFETQKVVTFIPPEGEFELMRYRCQEGISLPFKVLPVINEHGRTRLEMSVTIKSVFAPQLFALNVVVQIPVPNNTAKCNIVVRSVPPVFLDVVEICFLNLLFYTSLHHEQNLIVSSHKFAVIFCKHYQCAWEML